MDGEGWYEVRGKRYQVHRHQYFIIPAGVPHVYAASETDPWTIYWIHFRGLLARHYAGLAVDPQNLSPGVNSRISQRINLFEEIFLTLEASLTIESIRYAMSVFHHYLASLLYIKEYRSVGKQNVGTDVIEATIHYLGENIENHLTLRDIAEFSGFSPSHLSAMFKERTGHSPLNYFNLLKVRKACELLDTTKMTLTQINFKLGIQDQFYFSRLFSKIMGMLPRAYRALPKALKNNARPTRQKHVGLALFMTV